MERDERDANRRKYQRHTDKTPNSETKIFGELINLSGSEMELQLTSAINPKTDLIVSMYLEEECLFKGTVLWTIGDYINDQWIYKVGLETDTIAFEEATAVTPLEKNELLKSILPQLKTTGVNKISVKKAA